MFRDNQYIKHDDLYWPEILRKDIPKAKNALQPVFECFTNAIEAIKDKQKVITDFKGEIEIKIHAEETTEEGTFNFSKFSITDNGIGFNDSQFKRFNRFRDIRKNYKNLGSGRIQYVHYFDTTKVNSIFIEDDATFERSFFVSKKKDYLNNDSIVKHQYCKKIDPTETGTTITFNSIIDKSKIYDELNADILKEKILERYIHYFCYAKNQPSIKIGFYVQSKLISEKYIEKADIPQVDKQDALKLPYYKFSNGIFEKTAKNEEFNISAFQISQKLLRENRLNLVSKGEVIEDSYISLENLGKKDSVKGYKYLFLVASDYIDDRDSNLRGVLNIYSKDSCSSDLFQQQKEQIFIEDIQDGVSESISKMYPEIEEKKQEHNEALDKLKEMFLLDEETVSEINISINDSEGKILEKFYEAEAKKVALADAKIKKSIDNLDYLDTTSDDYEEKLESEIQELVKSIPHQNKNSLTKYVARRKLVLDLFGKIMDKEIEKLKKGGRIDEDLLHNLIFQQHSNNPEKSDLWLVNEDFIYFEGTSESQLDKVSIEGKKLFKDQFSKEVSDYLNSLGEKRLSKRPDVLLFPSEGKCIIIEFKAPEVNVSEHLSQMDYYANLIRNYTIDEYQITTFYGYLIGESIEDRDVRGRVGRFEHSYHLDYWFRPSEPVTGFEDRSDGNIYTEVLKYSTLLKRAKLRNQIFIDKLEGKK